MRGGISLRSWVNEGATLEGPAIVGVVNVTPDSFSDGGRFLDPSSACAQVDRLLAEGADVIEVGGESTRPAGTAYGEGFAPVDGESQLTRVSPVITHAVSRGARVAIDTTSPVVAARALALGAVIVNDVSLLADVALADAAASHGAWLVLMHARPGASSVYRDVVDEVAAEWSVARDRAAARGVKKDKIVMDPGLGFGKGLDDNLRLLAGLSRFHALGHAIYVGPSRKTFIGAVEERAGRPKSRPIDRGGGTIAACLRAARGGAAALRVHEVHPLRQALAVERAIDRAQANGDDVTTTGVHDRGDG